MSDYIDEIFGEGGRLARSELHAAVRPGQIEMARAVDRAIREDRNLLVEAGTGTGKTFAYLIPAIHHQLRTIVVTRNNLLADQLALKDLPLLARLLPGQFRFAILKGRNNYLCREKFNPIDPRPDFIREEDEAFDGIVDAWAHGRDGQAPTIEAGDLAELPTTVPKNLAYRYTASPEECGIRECGSYSTCWYYGAKARAMLASVIVTNYHMFFSHLRYARVLPDYRVVVLDEGHSTADIARDFWGFHLTAGAIVRIAQKVGGLSEKSGDTPDALKRRLIDSGNYFFDALVKYQQSTRQPRFKQPPPIDYNEVVGLLEQAADMLEQAAGVMVEEAEELVEKTDTVAAIAARKVARKQAGQLKRYGERAVAITEEITEAMTLANGRSFIYQVETKDGVALVSKAIDPAEFLANYLNDRVPHGHRNEDEEDGGDDPDHKPAGPTRHVHVLTSATLTTSALGGLPSFDYIAKSVGLEAPATCLADSPFQLDRQCRLIVPWTAPRPPEGRMSPDTRAERTKAWQRAIGDMLVTIVTKARGRTLALFTSNAAMDAAYGALVQAGLPYQILKQKDASAPKLVERFRQDVSSVLLGVDSFWQGVDVPGEALSCVVIDKLPYKHSAIDPVLDAIEERDGRDRAFNEYNRPRAVIQFRQAFGRLIRTEADKGVVIMLDSRVLEKDRDQFLGRLLDVPLVRDLDEIAFFLDGVEKPAFVMPPPPRVGIR